jgi:hypothetical protein
VIVQRVTMDERLFYCDLGVDKYDVRDVPAQLWDSRKILFLYRTILDRKIAHQSYLHFHAIPMLNMVRHKQSPILVLALVA